MKSIRQLVFLFLLVAKTIHVSAQGNECTDALELTNLTNYCSSNAQYTNSSSTPAANGLGIPTCFTTSSTYDVWFKFKATATDVQLSVTGGGANGTIKRPNIALYSGVCTGTVNEMACSPGNTDATSLYKGGLTIGATYMIRVATTTANKGTFKLCISNFTPTVTPGSDCDAVIQLCDTSSVVVPGLSGGGKNNKEIETNSCFYSPANPSTSIESNSSWFKWTCTKAGKLVFDIIPVDLTNDIDFILYELSGTSKDPCGTRTIIRCTATSCVQGKNGLNLTETDVTEPVNCESPNTNSNGYLKYVDMVVGKTYALLVNNFSAASGFSIKFTGSTASFATDYTPKITVSDSTICKGNNVTFSASVSGKYKSAIWTFSSGTPSTATTIGPHSIQFNTPGNYPVYLKVTDTTCSATTLMDSTKVTVFPLPIIDTTNLIVTNIIGGNSGSIKGIQSNGIKFNWYKSPSAIPFSTSDTSTYLVTDTAGLYYLEALDSNGCVSKSRMFEIKNEVPTSVDSKTTIDNFTLSPNPTTGQLDVRFSVSETTAVVIELNNVLGQSLKKETIKNPNQHVYYEYDLSNQNPGIYFVKITQGATTMVKRIVRQ